MASRDDLPVQSRVCIKNQFHSFVNLISNRPHCFERLAFRVGQRPVASPHPGTNGQASPQPIVTSTEAVCANPEVSFCGLDELKSMPISRIASTTSR
jgi:hypothetical protein